MKEEQTKKSSIIIAIDGYSGTGKSTLAKDLAKALSFVHIDSGSLYRALSYYFVKHQIRIDDPAKIEAALKDVKLELVITDGVSQPMLNGVILTDELKSPRVTNIVSEVAALEIVRDFLIEEQRSMAIDRSVVMDGRDIGTVIFPHADLKIFVTTSMDIRTERRQLELAQKGIILSKEEVRANLEKRDNIDSTRAIAPLKQASDAILLDTSSLTREEQLAWTLQKVEECINEKR